MYPIHGAASCGKVEVIIDLIDKHAINPRCKGNVGSWMHICMCAYNK